MRLNRPCELEDFRDPEAVAAMRFVEPDVAGQHADYPAGREHRKTWENQHTIRGARFVNALHGSSSALVLNAGTDRIVYALANAAGSVFAVDRYVIDREKQQVHSMLTEPWRHALFPYNARRLRVQHMDPTVLQYDDGTFDLVVWPRFSSHRAADEATTLVLLEVERVLKPGGIAVLLFEMAVDGQPAGSYVGFDLHTAQSLKAATAACPALEPVEEIRDRTTEATLAHPIALEQAVKDAIVGRVEYPHVLLRSEGRLFTSGAVFLRKA